MLTIVCVLKSGGDFTVEYVKNLKNAVARNVSISYRFICVTDLDIDFCETISLINTWDGWWSKIELFRKDMFDTEYVLYFDLDTVITKNIDNLCSLKKDFITLRPWNVQNRLCSMVASGMILFRRLGRHCDAIYENFNYANRSNYRNGDQQYITEQLRKYRVPILYFQDYIKGIYSYKNECKGDLPKDAKIVCFHGKPRPSAVSYLEWVKEHWR